MHAGQHSTETHFVAQRVINKYDQIGQQHNIIEKQEDTVGITGKRYGPAVKYWQGKQAKHAT